MTTAATLARSTLAPVDRTGFTALFRSQPGGVAVVTADAGAGPVALTATSVSSVSVEPPLLLLSVSDASSAAASIVAATTFVVHFIDARHVSIAELAATSGADRFGDETAWERLPSGEPTYPGVRRRLRARTVERVRAGSATVLIGEALEVATAQATGEHALVYHDRTWRSLGV